jgi:hypothetical protein
MDLYIKYRYKILFVCIFIIINFYLLINTPFDKIDSKEYLKLLIPISAIFLSLFLTKLNLIKIFKLLFYLLLIHIVFSFMYELATHGMLFNKSSDGRYYLQVLGRSAGETALAFYVLYVGTLFYFYLNSSLTKNQNILILLFFVVINISIISQSRTWLVIFLLFNFTFIIINRNFINILNILLSKKLSLIIYIAITLTILFGSNFLGDISKRMSHSVLSGRVEIWHEYIESQATNSTTEIILGRNLERKTLINKDAGIETSDSHNMFFDISQTFGAFGCLVLLVSFFFSISRGGINISTPILVAFIVTGFVMSPFKIPYLFYTNILLLIIPVIFSRDD